MNSYDFDQAWIKIDILEGQGLRKTAYKKLDEIYTEAKKAKQNDQLFKCVFYRGKYLMRVEEDGLLKTIEEFQKEADLAKQPEKSIFQSILAELYDRYLMKNMWKINQRSAVIGSEDKDFRNWSVKRFVDETTKMYLRSVENEQLKEITLDEMSALLTKAKNTDALRKTWYDVLAHRAIEYFKESKSYLSRSSGQVVFNDKKLFSEAEDFIKLDFKALESSQEVQALILYQVLLKKYLKDKNKAEILDLELNRNRFIKRNAVLGNADQLYETALIKLTKKYGNLQGVAEVYYHLANYYYTQGRNFQSFTLKDKKWKIKQALDICRSIIKTYPETYGSDQCKGLVSQIGRKTLRIKTEQVNLPGENIISLVEYQNLSKIYFRLIALNRTSYRDLGSKRSDELTAYINTFPALKSWSLEFPGTEDFRTHSAEIALDALELGVYALIVSDNPQFEFKDGAVQVASFFVSNLAYWHSNIGDKSFIYVVDRKTGKPVPDAEVSLFEWRYEGRSNLKVLTKSLSSNRGGYVSFENKPKTRSNYTIEIKLGSDELYFDNSVYGGMYNTHSRLKQRILFFLDRSIYRPGQTVYFKGLFIEENSDQTPEILPGFEDIKIDLLDVNQQKTEELVVNTNEFGTFSGSFTLPSGGLTGNMSIGSNQTRDRVYFSVEEYKRPKFNVVLNAYEQPYKLGDKIEVSGTANAYAGPAISKAKVMYRVKRKSYFPYWSRYMRRTPGNTNSVEVANGVVFTDREGGFKIPFRLYADDLIPAKYKPYYNFEVEADVVDLTGETHTDKITIRSGSNSLDVRIKLPDKIHRDSTLRVEVTSQNWNGIKQQLTGEIRIYKLQSPDKIFRNRFWPKPDTSLYGKETFGRLLPDYAYGEEDLPSNWHKGAPVQQFQFDTEKKNKFSFDFDTGTYKVELSFKDDDGALITIEKYSSVFDDKKLAPLNLFTLDVKAAEPGDNATFILQAAKERLPVLLEVFEKNERTIHEWNYPNLQNKIDFSVLEKHRGNFFVRASYVFNNRFYSIVKTVRVPWSNKALDFEYISFRSKLYPGQEEKWVIKVKGPKGEKVFSEMLACLYDASLDDIKWHNWRANLYSNNFLQSHINSFGFSQTRTRTYVDRNWNEYYYPSFRKTYRTINWFGMDGSLGHTTFKEDGTRVTAGERPPVAARSTRVASMELNEVSNEEELIVDKDYQDEVMDDNRGENQNLNRDKLKTLSPQIRSNLNETVFFYPHIRIDEKSNFTIEFTMNEALTAWKFLGFAHTKDLKLGITENRVITQKELMVIPNPPRFVRRGDELFFSTSISNLSDKPLSGSVELLLFDAETMEALPASIVKDDNIKSFSIEKGGNILTQWNLNIPLSGTDLILYQLRANSGAYTDGEEGILPVLSNRVLITETMPMWIGGNEKKKFVFERFREMRNSGVDSYNYTIETTSHPLWYAIQALPYVKNYSQKNSIQLANALYANLLSADIVRKNPAIKRVFDKWSVLDKQSNSDALLSNLEKNRELKNILLEETPWVLDAQDEESQKRNIALLFEINQVKQDKKQIIQLLQSLQMYDGGFSWFRGGGSSEYISLYVLEMLGKLKQLGLQTEDDKALELMEKKAIRFVDESFARRYNKLLERAKNDKIDLGDDHLGKMDIFYLYVRGFFRETGYTADAGKASVYYLNQIEKYWLNKGIYLQGMMALALHKNGNSGKAKNILRSLEDRSLFKEEMGRYWKFQHGYHWYEYPIETQALLIEAFHDIEQNKEIVNEMQIWLLKNKQTNRWKTAKATTSAIHALLINGNKALESKEKLLVTIGGESLKPKAGEDYYEAGTGYYKKSWSAKQLEGEMAEISLENPNEGIAWGAVYWQYFQDIDKIEGFTETPLSISKSLFISKDTKTGEQLLRLQKGDNINPGDKLVVRLRIEVDRPMEFVHLKDQKGAALESINQTSGYRWQEGLGYYINPRDAATHFFIEYLPRGVYLIEYPLRVVHSGVFSNGIATIQSMYAPEFSSHSEGMRIRFGPSNR